MTYGAARRILVSRFSDSGRSKKCQCRQVGVKWQGESIALSYRFPLDGRTAMFTPMAHPQTKCLTSVSPEWTVQPANGWKNSCEAVERLVGRGWATMNIARVTGKSLRASWRGLG
ncbi:hypothetical protein E2C01_074404 [Portunus trituberculatus]|uniref:Uncharacterized protein n=1 Tax=Portunus trituberculatus TaxID=210409 RepID=A0A5B7I7Y3_PORTR|nr:hypothetical protein [Portunus trituberculatus]